MIGGIVNYDPDLVSCNRSKTETPLHKIVTCHIATGDIDKARPVPVLHLEVRDTECRKGGRVRDQRAAVIVILERINIDLFDCLRSVKGNVDVVGKNPAVPSFQPPPRAQSFPSCSPLLTPAAG